MEVTIRTMTGREFEAFFRWSVEQQAKELAEEFRMPREAAQKEALAELAAMLPDGLHTKGCHLMTIVAEGEAAGYLWTIREETEGRRQSFVCDFAIREEKRRKGFGTAALLLAEQQAAEAGCTESVLFVADRNTAAQALYRKCGYRVLRQEGYGHYMIKMLP